MSEGADLFPSGATPSAAAKPETSVGSYQVLARRNRPQTFADVIGQEHVTQTLVNAIRTGRVAHGFVFSGMRGVGKTTTARILAKALNCEKGPTPEPCNVCGNCVEITEGRSLDVFEVDAASQTGIDATRELLETVKYQPASGLFRIYIIDEAHGLSKQAVDAFLKTLEEPPPHVKFILATTAAHKLPATILSRCQRFDFRAVSRETIARCLGEIVRREGMEADEDALLTLARESGGSMRDATSLLDQVLAFAGGRVGSATITEALGLPDRRAVRELLAAACARSPADALDVLARTCAQGTDLARFCEDLLERIRHESVLLSVGERALVDFTPVELEELKADAVSLSLEDLQRWFRIVLQTHGDLSRAPDPRLVLEMAVLRMATTVPLVPLQELIDRLEAIESGDPRPRPSGGARPTARVPVAAPTPAAARDRSPVPRASAPTATERPADAVPPPSGEGAGDVVVTAAEADQARWSALVDTLQRERPSRFFRLSYSKLVDVDGDRLRVAVTGRDAATALKEKETREAIESAIERAFGRRLSFEPIAPGAVAGASGPTERPSLDRQAQEDPVVRLSVELLDARVEAVVPRGRR